MSTNLTSLNTVIELNTVGRILLEIDIDQEQVLVVHNAISQCGTICHPSHFTDTF